MQALFLVCFVVGLGLTGVLSVLTGVGGHAGHGGAHLHAGHAAAQLPAAHAHAVAAGHSGAVQAHGVSGGGSPILPALDWTLSWRARWYWCRRRCGSARGELSRALRYRHSPFPLPFLPLSWERGLCAR